VNRARTWRGSRADLAVLALPVKGGPAHVACGCSWNPGHLLAARMSKGYSCLASQRADATPGPQRILAQHNVLHRRLGPGVRRQVGEGELAG
jgi:hypothetical protein